LVFDNRNKDYGAYDLRKHYAGNLVKAMAIAFFSVAFLYTGYSILFKVKPVATYREIPDIPIQPMIETHPKIVVPPKPATIIPHVQVSTTRYPVMVVTHDKDAENPPKLTELETTAISAQTSKGKDEGINVDIQETGPGNNEMGKETETDNVPKDWAAIEVLPTPYGGAAAWAKFLQKNIHYPARATEEGKQGKVFLSFIVEKDGRLSNIVVDRPMGFGLDEEAVRVLKLAPAWKPGIQNGHAVRVKFTIPINFQIADPD
ncbi:MAG: energy transducer TonB, partial [Mucilaginibacter sp.]|nr:energy transducer TonB [Mucilaginibacter sp.]